MYIRLNGDRFEISGPMTIEALLAQLDIHPRRVAVEHNLAIIKRDRYATTTINDGDSVEIVNFVGGGEATSGSGIIRGPGSGGRDHPGAGIRDPGSGIRDPGPNAEPGRRARSADRRIPTGPLG